MTLCAHWSRVVRCIGSDTSVCGNDFSNHFLYICHQPPATPCNQLDNTHYNNTHQWLTPLVFCSQMYRPLQVIKITQVSGSAFFLNSLVISSFYMI